jgi:Uma2 family endonuclease
MSVLHAPAYRWTVEEYEELGRAGFFQGDRRVELLHGEIIVMSPIGLQHATAVNRLTKFFVRRSRDRYIVSPQNSFDLDDNSQPQPDITLFDPVCDTMPRRAEPPDIFLVIEVADSTLRYDREDKCPAYAKNGICEYWILNLQDRVLEVFRDSVDGTYQERRTFGPQESIAPLAFPDVELRVGDVLP